MIAAKRLSEWGSDELIFLDISQNSKYDLNRDDQGYSNNRSFLDIIEEVSKSTFILLQLVVKLDLFQILKKD